MSTVSVMKLKTKWRGLSLDLGDFDRMIEENFQGQDELEWRPFLAAISLGVAHDGAIETAMKIISESFSDLSKGEGFALNTNDFIDMFKHVAALKNLDCGKINEVAHYLRSAGAKQGGMLSFENFRADLCPCLE